jgi:dolichol-phosphate mannosyltransferase
MHSVVIPVYNERECLVELHRELDEVAQQHGYVLEMIFVDDGSTDGSWEVIERLAGHDRRVAGIRLRRNFGKASALSAGLDCARGEFVITLDGDLQDDPREIPRFLAKMECGLDVVSGWKKTRHDPWHKVLPSYLFNWMVSRMTKVYLHDHNCGFKCYRRQIFDEIRLYGELHRFVPVMAAARGWRVGELEVNHRPRKFGRSKYGLARIPKGMLDLLTVKFLTGFGQRPQHLLGAVGLVFLVAGGLGLTWLTIYWFVSRIVESFEPVHLHERAVFYYSIAALLLGAQCTSIGLLAELLTAVNSSRQPSYSVSERTGHAASPQVGSEHHTLQARRSS